MYIDLYREIKYQTETESRKIELIKRYDWSYKTAFSTIDITNEGYVTAE